MDKNTEQTPVEQEPMEQAPLEQEQQETVPYAQYEETFNQVKAAEQALADVTASLVAEIPEAMRGLVPDLPPTQKIIWLLQAKKAGLLQSQAPKNSPDHARPLAKPDVDLNTQNPFVMMQHGYN